MMQRNNHLPTHLLALLLMCSLLVAQWTGLQHRVAHAWQQASIPALAHADQSTQDSLDKDLFHSCTLLDASTVGACIATAGYKPPLYGNPSFSIVILPLISWQALFTRQFSSRAPPFLKLV
jgi:hypothetical protein